MTDEQFKQIMGKLTEIAGYLASIAGADLHTEAGRRFDALIAECRGALASMGGEQ